MASIVDSKPISDLIGRYYNVLTQVGYVDGQTLYRLVMYLFLVSFVDCEYMYMSDDDFHKVDKVLSDIFSGCNCLLEYDKNIEISSHYSRMDQVVNGITIGRPWHMTNDTVARVTEEDVYRFTEDSRLRTL